MVALDSLQLSVRCLKIGFFEAFEACKILMMFKTLHGILILGGCLDVEQRPLDVVSRVTHHLHEKTGNSSWKIKWFAPYHLGNFKKYGL